LALSVFNTAKITGISYLVKKGLVCLLYGKQGNTVKARFTVICKYLYGRSSFTMKPRFFTSAQAFRNWLEKNHAIATELVAGFYKLHSGKPSMTWSESVDQALCFGWIDGVRTSIDNDRYQIRFTPRKPNSIWSAVNLKKIKTLTSQGLMHPAGLASFENRNTQKTKLYTHENKAMALLPLFEKKFKANKNAWTYFQSLAASYQKLSINWVMSAKQEATRLKRLQTLISDSEAGTNQWKDNKYRKK